MPPMIDHRGDGNADLGAHAAEHDDGQDDGALQKREELRIDEALARAEERAGKTAEAGPDGERRELGVGGVDAERAAGDLVLAQRLPRAPDRQAAQAQGDPGGEQGQPQDHVEEEDGAIERRELEPEDGGEAARR